MELERERGISITSTVLQFRIRRPHPQPARHAGPPRFRRGHLPHAAGRRQRGHAHRRGQRRRAADEKAVRDLPRARHSALHVHEQARSAEPRSARAARRTREGARHRRLSDELAARQRRRVSRRLRPAARAPCTSSSARRTARRARRSRSPTRGDPQLRALVDEPVVRAVSRGHRAARRRRRAASTATRCCAARRRRSSSEAR